MEVRLWGRDSDLIKMLTMFDFLHHTLNLFGKPLPPIWSSISLISFGENVESWIFKEVSGMGILGQNLELQCCRALMGRSIMWNMLVYIIVVGRELSYEPQVRWSGMLGKERSAKNLSHLGVKNESDMSIKISNIWIMRYIFACKSCCTAIEKV
jgi:hypothetical protein